jgi:uncharacterized protein (TIGR02271 family)
MAYETTVAAFDTRAHADAAVKALRAGGFANADISIFDEKRLAGAKEPGIWQRLFGRDLQQHEASIYRQTIQRGGVVVSARVLDTEVAQAIAILDLHRPVDLHDRAGNSGIERASHVEAAGKKTEKVPPAAAQKAPPKPAEAHDEVLHLAEEQLEVGKKVVESGRTRVRRFVTEREASADVTLHREHGEVVRRAITDPKFEGAIDWADKVIEVIETAEQALANKTARIVEEVALKKVRTDRVETVKDKLRRQNIEIERIGADGKVIPGSGARESEPKHIAK